MPITRDPSGTVLNLPVRQPIMPAMPWKADRVKNLTALATQSVTATYGLWFELLENQRRFAARLLGAMGVSVKAEARPSMVDMQDGKRVEQEQEPVAADSAEVPRSPLRKSTASKATPAEFPIKGYDRLTVQEIAGKFERLRDQGQIKVVLAYEAKNKARKGVASSGEARLERLTHS